MIRPLTTAEMNGLSGLGRILQWALLNRSLDQSTLHRILGIELLLYLHL